MEFGMLSTGMLHKATVWFARRAVTLEPGHPTGTLWGEGRCPVRTALRYVETKVVGQRALHLSADEASSRLLRHQLGSLWDEEDHKHPLPVALLKFTVGPSLYLLKDDKSAASR